MFRSNDRRREGGGGGGRRGGGESSMDDNLASYTGGGGPSSQQQQQNDNDDDHNNNDVMSDDDNAAPDMQSEVDDVEKEDPLLLAIDDLEGRVVAALDDVKVHPGIRTPMGPSVPEELAMLLRPVLEVAAHTSPSVARTYYRGVGAEGVEASCEDVYQRVVSDLVLPVLLEMAQSDTIPAKRGASLEFFRQLWKECHKPGSWLDPSPGANAGPYGSGQSSSSSSSGKHHAQQNNQPRAQSKRRQAKRMAREGEILRYWVQASIATTLPGVFTDEAAESAIAARGVIAASASLRPSLKHIAQRIRDTDDRGANRIYGPVMKMVEGVLKKLFLGTDTLSSNAAASAEGDALRSACLKFLEIVCLCCSTKPPQDTSSQRRRTNTPDDFSLEDLPTGHPIITREALESVAEYAFSALRGLTLLGGQVKMDINLLSDMMLRGDNTPSAQVVSILKPAALAFLELEAGLPKADDEENALEVHIDRSNLEFDFLLSAKSYALTVNAISAIAINRPVFFKEGAICLVRRAADPLTYNSEDGTISASSNSNYLPKNAVLGIQAQIKASCLTLLRNALSVQTQAANLLHKCLAEKCDMQVQADKALKMAEQTTALKTAGRAARNRAIMFYEWESAAADTTGRTSKRQRETDDALAKMKAARASRGLGHGIQLPTSMVDSIELILANLQHLPAKRPATAASTSSSSSAKGKTTTKTSSTTSKPISLDFVMDAIITNGASLAQEEGRWYSRDGGSAWTANPDDGTYELSSKLLAVASSASENHQEQEQSEPPKKKAKQQQGDTASTATTLQDQKKMYTTQCQTAAAEAVGRIVTNAITSRNGPLTEMANRVAARLAWTLKNVAPPPQLQLAQDMALDTIESAKKRLGEEGEASSSSTSTTSTTKSMDELAKVFPLVTSCLALEATSALNYGTQDGREAASLSNAVLNEAYAQDCQYDDEEKKEDVGIASSKYKASLDVYAGSVLHSSERANSKATDNDRKRIATHLASKMQHEFGILPQLTSSGLKLISAMCDIDDIAKKAKEAAQKQSQQSIATSAALHAAKQAAEKRATAALLVLRDAAFQRTNPESRRGAVRTAVALASGHFGASPSCEDKALKLVMNVLYARSEDLANAVVESAIAELKVASDYAIKNYSKIQKANKEAAEKEIANEHAPNRAPFAPDSDEEKAAMDKVRKPAVLFMALCIRRPEIIKTLFELSSVPKADVLSKAVRQQMSKLARAAGTKHGSAEIALKVADMASPAETPLLLAFLDNLAPLGEKGIPPQEFIDACFEIQEMRKAGDTKDARFLIPVVSAMMREDLIQRLPEFVDADDSIFMAALVKMGERLGRQALLHREELEPEKPTLKGLTGCEQLVELHKLDFQAAGLPQKRYLDAIRLCLDSEDIFTDSLVMSALDHMSGVFLTGAEKLPLAFMRTIILVCSKHESLHSWICHTLLPRLVEGKIYEDRRQWEGWMRCAKILENNSGSGASSADAINQLPPEQLALYQARYGSS